MNPGVVCARRQDRKEKTAKTVCTGRKQRPEKRNRTEIKDRIKHGGPDRGREAQSGRRILREVVNC